MTGCNNPCYPCYPCNPCSPCGQPTNLIINGCICIENQTTTEYLGNGNSIVLTLHSGSTTATYRAQGVTRADANGNSGGGALLNILQGIGCECQPCPGSLNLTANISLNGAVQTLTTPLTFRGCCGGTITSQTEVVSSGTLFASNTLTLSIYSNKQCCGGCTTCSITGGKLTIS